MSESNKETLDILEQLVEQGVSVKTALESAFRLGKLEGGMEMAQVGQKIAEAA